MTKRIKKVVETVVDGAPVMKRGRGRPVMTDAQKEAQKLVREAAVGQRSVALDAINTNPQFQTARFWAGVDKGMTDKVSAAIAKASAKVAGKAVKAKAREIKALQRKLAKLQG